MTNPIKSFLRKARAFWWAGGAPLFNQPPVFDRNDTEIEDQRRLNDPVYLERFGYKVYSQNDEDGIIAEIFRRIGTTDRRFVEFGVQNGLESNCHYLLHQGWRGLWIDGSPKFCASLGALFAAPLASGQLRLINAFITTDNINRLIGEEGGIKDEIDLLSVDIDGNDYWVWEAITCVKPRVVIIEYNAKFPPPYEWVMPYNSAHVWDGSDLQGASLKALEKLGARLGYQLVGTNMNGVNAFFVRGDLAGGLFPQPATAENLYHSWRSRRYISSGHPTRRYIGN